MANDMLVIDGSPALPAAPLIATQSADTALQRTRNACKWRREEKERSAFRAELLDLSSHCVPS